MGGLQLSFKLKAATSRPQTPEPLIESWHEKTGELVEQANFEEETCSAVLRSRFEMELGGEVVRQGKEATLSFTFPDHAGMCTLSMHAWFHWTSLTLAIHRAEFEQELRSLGWQPATPLPTVRDVMLRHAHEGPELRIHEDGELVGLFRGDGYQAYFFRDNKDWKASKKALKSHRFALRDPLTQLGRALWPSGEVLPEWARSIPDETADTWIHLALPLCLGKPGISSKKHAREAFQQAFLGLNKQGLPYLMHLASHGNSTLLLELTNLFEDHKDKRLAWEGLWRIDEAADEAGLDTANYGCLTSLFEAEREAIEKGGLYFAALWEASQRKDDLGKAARHALDPSGEGEALGHKIERALAAFPEDMAVVLRVLLTREFGYESDQDALWKVFKGSDPSSVEALLKVLASDKREGLQNVPDQYKAHLDEAAKAAARVAKPKASKQTTRPKAAKVAKPKATKKTTRAAKPKATKQTTRPKATKFAAKPRAAKQTTRATTRTKAASKATSKTTAAKATTKPARSAGKLRATKKTTRAAAKTTKAAVKVTKKPRATPEASSKSAKLKAPRKTAKPRAAKVTSKTAKTRAAAKVTRKK